MTISPQIAEYAADVRRRRAARPSTVRAETRRIAKRAAGDLAKDLPGIDDAQLGAVLLWVAAFAHNLAQAQPGATVGNVAGLLEAAGEYLYHHSADAISDCEG